MSAPFAGEVLKQHQQPLLHSLAAKVKISALGVSGLYLALGTSTGSIYFYRRGRTGANEGDRLTFLRMVSIPSSSRAQLDLVTHISFSPDSQLVAVATSRPLVLVLDCSLTKLSEKEKVLTSLTEHKARITALCWDPQARYVLSGDSAGVVWRLVPPVAGSLFASRKADVLCQQDAGVVQLASSGPVLLVTTRKTALTIQLDDPNLTPRKVGSKPRSGPYGACFDARAFGQMYLARPGRRLWLAETATGNVKATLKPVVKDARQLAPYSLRLPPNAPLQQLKQDKQLQFSLLVPFQGALLTYSVNFLLVIDPTALTVSEWFEFPGPVLDLKPAPPGAAECFYVLHKDRPDNTAAAAAATTHDPAQGSKVVASQLILVPLSDCLHELLEQTDQTPDAAALVDLAVRGGLEDLSLLRRVWALLETWKKDNKQAAAAPELVAQQDKLRLRLDAAEQLERQRQEMVAQKQREEEAKAAMEAVSRKASIADAEPTSTATAGNSATAAASAAATTAASAAAQPKPQTSQSNEQFPVSRSFSTDLSASFPRSSSLVGATAGWEPAAAPSSKTDDYYKPALVAPDAEVETLLGGNEQKRKQTKRKTTSPIVIEELPRKSKQDRDKSRLQASQAVLFTRTRVRRTKAGAWVSTNDEHRAKRNAKTKAKGKSSRSRKGGKAGNLQSKEGEQAAGPGGQVLSEAVKQESDALLLDPLVWPAPPPPVAALPEISREPPMTRTEPLRRERNPLPQRASSQAWRAWKAEQTELGPLLPLLLLTEKTHNRLEAIRTDHYGTLFWSCADSGFGPRNPLQLARPALQRWHRAFLHVLQTEMMPVLEDDRPDESIGHWPVAADAAAWPAVDMNVAASLVRLDNLLLRHSYPVNVVSEPLPQPEQAAGAPPTARENSTSFATQAKRAALASLASVEKGIDYIEDTVDKALGFNEPAQNRSRTKYIARSLELLLLLRSCRAHLVDLLHAWIACQLAQTFKPEHRAEVFGNSKAVVGMVPLEEEYKHLLVDYGPWLDVKALLTLGINFRHVPWMSALHFWQQHASMAAHLAMAPSATPSSSEARRSSLPFGLGSSKLALWPQSSPTKQPSSGPSVFYQPGANLAKLLDEYIQAATQPNQSMLREAVGALTKASHEDPLLLYRYLPRMPWTACPDECIALLRARQQWLPAWFVRTCLQPALPQLPLPARTRAGSIPCLPADYRAASPDVIVLHIYFRYLTSVLRLEEEMAAAAEEADACAAAAALPCDLLLQWAYLALVLGRPALNAIFVDGPDGCGDDADMLITAAADSADEAAAASEAARPVPPCPYRRGAHRAVWPCQDLLLSVLEPRQLSRLLPASLDQLASLFQTLGFLPGLYALARLHDCIDVSQLVRTTAAVGDQKMTRDLAFKHLTARAAQSVPELTLLLADWTFLLSTACAASAEAEDRVPLQVLVGWMASCVGLDIALELLMGFPEFLDASEQLGLGSEFYQLLLVAERLRLEEQDAVWQVLETVDSYLWSQRTPTLPPQVRELVAQLQQRVKSRSGVGRNPIRPEITITDPFQVEGPGRVKVNFESEDVNLYPYRGLEDNGGHWGLATAGMVRCPCCALNLDMAAEPNPQAVFFPCGHIYHKDCVFDGACVLCLESNFSL